MKVKIPELKFDLNLAFLVVLVSILIIPFVHTTHVLDPSLSPRLVVLNISVVILGLTVLFFAWEKPDGYSLNIFHHNIFKVYLSYVVMAGISIPFATNTSEAIFEWFKLFSIFIYFCLLTWVLNSSKNYIHLILKTAIIFTILITLRGIYEIISVASIGSFNHQISYFIRAFSSNRNLYSQVLLLCLPFTLYGIYKFKTVWKVFSIIGSALSLLLIVILLTRSVWIAFLFSSLVCYVVLIFNRKTFLLNKKSVRIFIGIPVVAILIISTGVFIYSRIGSVEVFEKQTYWIQNYKFGSSLERVDLWEKTIKMSIDHPITGVGQGNWRIIFPTYKLDDLRSETGEVFFQRPHNDFLWVLSENGILGFVFYLLIFVISFYYLFQMINRSPVIEKKYMALTLVFGLTAYVVIAMFSFPKERFEHQIFLHIILAVALVEYNKIRPKRKKKNNRFILILLTLFLVPMIFGSYLSISRLSSEVHIAKASKFRTQGDWENQIVEYKLASTKITQMDAYSTPIYWYIGEAWMNLKNSDSAHFYFQKALKIHPYHLHVLNNLGTTYEMKGNHSEAENLFLKAHELSSGFEDPLFNLCALYYNKGDYLFAYKTILKVAPESENPKYKSYLEAILWKLTNKLANEIPEKMLSNSILRIRNDKKWMIKVHEQSIFDSTNYEKQLIIESIYLLESVDSTISEVEAEKYRQKFNLRRI